MFRNVAIELQDFNPGRRVRSDKDPGLKGEP